MHASLPRPKDPMSKHWCFTLNNYTLEEYNTFTLCEKEYLVMGKELSEPNEETGERTPHLQGYIVFVNRKRLAGVKKVSPKAHWEIKRGTPLEASEYCKKDGDFLEQGILPELPHEVGGKATQDKWQKAWDDAKRAKFESIDVKMLIQHYQTFKKIAQDYQTVPPDLTPGVKHEWYWGAPRTGKSRAARFNFPGAYDKPCNKWWDGYQNHEFVIIDDFDKTHKCLGHHLKRWADIYSFPAEHKGHTYQIRPKTVIVTSNYHPSQIFDDDPVLLEAILSRFNLTEFSKNPYNVWAPHKDRPTLKRTHGGFFKEIDPDVSQALNERLKKGLPNPLSQPIDLTQSYSSLSSSDTEVTTSDAEESSSIEEMDCNKKCDLL